MGFLWCFFYRFGFFWFFSLLGFFLGFWQRLPFGRQFLVYFVVVFSARARGAGFRPGVFSYGLHHLDDGLNWVEVCCSHNHCGYTLFLYLSLRPSASARDKI